MRAIAQGVKGKLISANGRGTVILDPSRETVYLRYALVERSKGDLIFPELLMDDWGHEINTLHLYRWIMENGIHFPRAEVFGYDRQGNSRQCFIRELELQAKYPCFGFFQLETRLEGGVEIPMIILAVDEPILVESKPDIGAFEWPLQNAAVEWWRVESENAIHFAQSLLLKKNDKPEKIENSIGGGN